MVTRILLFRKYLILKIIILSKESNNFIGLKLLLPLIHYYTYDPIESE